MTNLRPLLPSDIAAVDPLLMAAYENPSSYRPRLERLLRLEPAGWLVAVEEGRIIGTGGLTVMGKTGWIGLVAVAAESRRRGVARLVMERLIEMAGEAACVRILLDASAAGRELYERLGFVAEDGADLWRRPADGPEPAPPRGEPRGIRVERGTPGDGGLARAGILRPELAALDLAAFGDDRAKVLASYIADDPRALHLARDRDDALCGFALAQSSGALGPWVARDPVAGGALLDALLAGREGAELSVCLPSANVDAAAALAARGFVRVRGNTHMRRGEPLPRERRRLIWGQASFALG